jgi:predicted short-subunit dehydrogenase-like oxidoreductase (DUF2520 family)
MTFSIIGTGNIAWFFGKRLAAGGHRCKGVFGRTEASTRALADALLSNKWGDISDVRDEEADVCFLAVSDNAIAEIAAKLSFKKTILVHMSGAQSVEIIKTAAKDCAVLWPVYSILKNNTPAHRDIPFAWEVSTDRAKKYVLEMAHAITDNLFEAKDEQRKWLHLAAVMTNNFINHLLSLNEQICKENNLPKSALQPIINQTFERLKTSSPQAIQTGPAIRGDKSTIEQHEQLLAGHPEWLKVYEAMTASIQAMHKK